MSRSYRRPYSAVTGHSSAKDDKRHANRGVRRGQNQYLRNIIVGNLDWDETLIPHKLECSYNEVYSWGRDGKQGYCPAPNFGRSSFLVMRGIRTAEEIYEEDCLWYKRIQRK